jgi:8-oxo-dGTP pyrophosphatase MutT (NUDIX family)
MNRGPTPTFTKVPSPPAVPNAPPREGEPISRECVEGYLFATPPLRLLLFRRPPSRGAIWVPVSGKVDPEDASFEAALLRELREETGLSGPLSVIPLDWHVPFRADNGEVWRLHAYAVEVGAAFEPHLSDEHDGAEWVTPAEAAHRLHYPDNQAAVGRVVAAVERRPRNP